MSLQTTSQKLSSHTLEIFCLQIERYFQDHADLASVSTLEEHRFISAHLNLIDPQHRRWYISTRQEQMGEPR